MEQTIEQPYTVTTVRSILSLPRSYFDFRGSLSEAITWLFQPRRYGEQIMTPAQKHGWSQIIVYVGEMPGWQIVAIT